MERVENIDFQIYALWNILRPILVWNLIKMCSLQICHKKNYFAIKLFVFH